MDKWDSKRQKISEAKNLDEGLNNEEVMVEASTDELEVDGSAKIILRFPSFSEDHIALSRKKWLEKKNLTLEFEVPVPLQEETADICLKDIIYAARIIHLDKVLFYFAEDDNGPFSPRNELEALSSILSSLAISISQSGSDAVKALEKLQQKTMDRILSLGNDQSVVMHRITDADADADSAAATNDLLAWAKNGGMETMLDIACFQEAGRGLVASRDIQIGDVVLEIPMRLVITENLFESDVADDLEFNLVPNDKRWLWIMKERCNSHSKFKSYFDSLPTKFRTGLSFGKETLEKLDGTELCWRIEREKQDLGRLFDLKINPLLKKYDVAYQSASSNWDEFMFAVELWNSNSVNVIFGEGVRTCLVPVAGFFNHSECPHILNGIHVSGTNSIQFIASRPCKKGEQCYLSYGNLSANDLVTFYGFLPNGPNYHNTVELGFRRICDEGGIGFRSHMLRGKSYSGNGKPWAKALIDCLCAYLKAPFQLTMVDHTDVMKLALTLLEMKLSAMCCRFEELFSELCCDDIDQCSWDEKLSFDYICAIAHIYDDAFSTCLGELAGLDVHPP